jgi:uncharacterized protein (DUF1501 family)
MHRRNFLRQSLAATTLASTGLKLFAAPTGTPRVLVVFLRGAYDAASLLVPVNSDFYYEQRPNIAVARPGSAEDAAVALEGAWGLHPALQDSLLPLYQKRQLAFIPFAGTDDTSRSHFETQDSIELGQPLDGKRHFDSGFMNRLAQVLGTRDAIAFTAQVPLCFRGSVAVPNLALNRFGKPAFDARQTALLARMYQGTALGGAVQEGFAVQDQAVRDIGGPGAGMSGGMSTPMAAPADVKQEMADASRNAITAQGFEGEAIRVARLMRDRYHLGFLDVGGWDTHVGQGNGRGYLANRLGELGRGLAAYATEMGPAWNDSVVVVISEFGRTFKENGNRGTDHGHGTVYWVLGGAVHGGRLAGEQVAVAPSALFQNRDYPVLNEYRATLGGLFSRVYGLSAAQAEVVFPGAQRIDLALT